MNAQQLIHWERVQRLTARRSVARVEVRTFGPIHGRYCICSSPECIRQREEAKR